MSDVVDFVEDVGGAITGAASDLLEAAWDAVVEPIAEEVFSWFGIEDETVVEVQYTSVKVYGDNPTDTVKAAIIQAVLNKMHNGGGFFPNYMQQVNVSRAQIRSYYNYAERGLYLYGLPDTAIKGQQINLAKVKESTDLEFTINSVILLADQSFPSPLVYYQNELQLSPYFYLPGPNTLTFPDQWGNDRTWTFDSVDTNAGDYTVNLSRTANRVLGWIYGPETVIEGEDAACTIYLSDTVPAGKTLIANLTYSGTAVDGVDYTEVASVNLTVGMSSIAVPISTIENVSADGARNFTVTLDSLDNTDDVFDDVAVHVPLNSVTVNIIDDEGQILTMPHGLVSENATNITIPVTLNAAAGGAFTVDYDFTDIEATGIIGGGGGSDYDSTTGTLNFDGDADEIQNITVPITGDVAADDQERFQINLLNCSDGAITLTNTKVTIWDGSDDPASPQSNLVESITVPFFVDDETIVIHYKENGEPDIDYKIWHYSVATDVYPDMHFKEQTFTENQLLPVLPLRGNKLSIDNASSALFPALASTKKMFRRLQLDLDDILENIHADASVADIDDIYLNFAICPNDKNRVVSKLLYELFYQMHVLSSLQSNNNKYMATYEEQDIQNAMVWSDFSWTPSIPGTSMREKVDIAGNFIDINDDPIVDPDPPYMVPVPVGEYHHVMHTGSASDDEDPSILTLRKQFDGSYSELTITALNSMVSIAYTGEQKTAFQRLGDKNQCVPITKILFNELSYTETLEVYQFMLRLNFSAISITHLEWYESDAFFNLFEFVLIAITVISLGTASSFTTALYQLAANYLIIELVIYIAELTGNEALAAIVGVVAMIALSDGSFSTFGDMETADMILKITSNFAQGYQASMGVTSEALKQEFEAIESAYNDRIDEIERFNEDNDQLIDVNFIVAMQSINTNLYKAIENQYDYQRVYDGPKTAVEDFVKNRLAIGVV